MNILKKNIFQKGFTIIEVVMSLAILTTVIMVVITNKENSVVNSVRNIGQVEYSQLTSEFLSIFSRDFQHYCHASLVDPAPGSGVPGANQVKFEAQDIQELETNGMQIELWSGSQADFSSRRQLKLKENMPYGELIIDSVLLYLPDHNTMNLPVGVLELQAEVVVSGRRKINSASYKNFPKLRKLLTVEVSTNGAGLSSITNCVGLM